MVEIKLLQIKNITDQINYYQNVDIKLTITLKYKNRNRILVLILTNVNHWKLIIVKSKYQILVIFLILFVTNESL